MKKTITLELVETDVQKSMVKDIIENHHSYVASNSSVGRRIDWVVFNDDKPIGMIGIGSSVYPPPKDILKHTKLSIKEYKNKFNSFANTCCLFNSSYLFI